MKAIIFDFDGVIGDTKEINYSISKLTNPDLTVKKFEDHHNGNVFEKPLFSSPDNFHELQKERFTKDNLFPLVDEIKAFSDNYLLFVVSSSREDNIEHFLALGNVKTCFQEILGSGFHTSKVEKFKYIFNKYDLSNEDCVFITDTIGDVKEARQVHLRSIAVTWGYHARDVLESEKPFKTVSEFDEVKEIVESM